MRRMNSVNWVKRKTNIHGGSGDRTDTEKRVGNAYLNCDYEDVE